MHAYLALGYVRTLVTLILVAILIALAAYATYTFKQSRYIFMGPTTISVTGTAEVQRTPDIGQFSFSVTKKATDAVKAQDDSAKAMNDILAYLTEAGIAESDVKTVNYYLNPTYKYSNSPCSPTYCPPAPDPVIDGYEVSQMIEVKVRNLESVGDLLSGVGARGATNVSGLSFTVDDENDAKAEARQEAIADAKQKADKLAIDLGVRLVRMTGYWEEEYPVMPYYGYGKGGGDMMMDAAMAPATPYGENTITSRVNISYEVK